MRKFSLILASSMLALGLAAPAMAHPDPNSDQYRSPHQDDHNQIDQRHDDQHDNIDDVHQRACPRAQATVSSAPLAAPAQFKK
jgi:hypothetical protein